MAAPSPCVARFRNASAVGLDHEAVVHRHQVGVGRGDGRSDRGHSAVDALQHPHESPAHLMSGSSVIVAGPGVLIKELVHDMDSMLPEVRHATAVPGPPPATLGPSA